MFGVVEKLTDYIVRKKNLYSFLMAVLMVIVLVLFVVNLYQHLRTSTMTKPFFPQSDGIKEQIAEPSPPKSEGVKVQITEAIATPSNEAATFADFQTNTNEGISPDVIYDPVETVYDFYKALQNKECDKALQIQPSYKGCASVNNVNYIHVDLLQKNTNWAAVNIDFSIIKDAKEISFVGYLWLKRGENKRWQIQSDIMEKDKITIEHFLSEKAGIMVNKETNFQKRDVEIPDAIDNASQLPPTTPTSKKIDVTSIHSFGSQKILSACWSPEQLRGNTLDKKLQKTAPDHSSPNRLFSKHQLKPLEPRLQGSIRTVRMPDPSKKLVALTFDLCERASEVTGYDAELVNYLRDNNIKATFYAGGKWMRSHPEKAKQLMADPRFELGNHAWTHGNMRVLSGDELQNQVRWTQAQYELLWEELAQDAQQCGVSPSEINKIPPLPLSFRYPYGTCGIEALDFMAEQGLPSVQWNIVTADPWHKQTAEGIAKTIVQGIKPGSIIIAHANGRGWKTSEALPQFIPSLKAKGYEFVTVTELFQQGIAVEATDLCYQLKPGDNAFYDKKVGNGTE
jgi:peptidoglycan/xylan/chitin deacetylase (PgdA/CDA1 family)